MNHVILRAEKIGDAKFLIVHTYQTGRRGVYFVWRKTAGGLDRVGFTENLADLSRLWNLATGEPLAGPLGDGVHYA